MTTPADASRCSRCGAAKPVREPCPHCLLQLGLARPEPGAGARAAPRLAPDPAALARHFPGLEIQELVGQGGMGVVYRARHRKLDRVVALKLLAPELSGDPAFAERFLREARAMARLDHPNIVAVHDFGESDGLCWLLMEYVDGTNLRQAMAQGALTPAQALAIVPQLCDALQAAHDLGVVHRDIKPENVLLDRAGKVKIADFGLAKLSGGGAAPNLTSTDAAMGTLHYMAPEQLVGAHEVDHRADIFSLGVVFYEMLTGQLPLGRFEPPSRRVELDARLDEIVLRALEQEPRRRYQHALEVKTDVQAVSAAGPAVPAPVSAGQDASPAAPERGWFQAWRARPYDGLVPWLFAGLMLFPLLARALWPWGVPGLVLLLAAGVFWLYVVTLRLAQKALGAALGLRSGRERSARAAGFCLAASVGLAALGVALETSWERGTDHYVSPTPHLQARAGAASEERGYELLQLLRNGDESSEPALPELGTPQIDRYLRVHLANPLATAGVALLFLLLAGLAQASAGGRTLWRVALGAPLGATALVLVAFGLVQVNQGGWPSTLMGVGGSVRFEADVERVQAALAARLEARGRTLVLEIGETLVEKRSREPLARHELLAAQPGSPFERWALEKGGPRRARPSVVFDAIGTLDGSRTVLVWNAGMVVDGAREGETWRAEVEALLEDVRRTVTPD